MNAPPLSPTVSCYRPTSSSTSSRALASAFTRPSATTWRSLTSSLANACAPPPSETHAEETRFFLRTTATAVVRRSRIPPAPRTRSSIPRDVNALTRWRKARAWSHLLRPPTLLLPLQLPPRKCAHSCAVVSFTCSTKRSVVASAPAY